MKIKVFALQELNYLNGWSIVKLTADEKEAVEWNKSRDHSVNDYFLELPIPVQI